jgi:hypothetical protein
MSFEPEGDPAPNPITDPAVEHPAVEHPAVERPDVERLDVERPDAPGGRVDREEVDPEDWARSDGGYQRYLRDRPPHWE